MTLLQIDMVVTNSDIMEVAAKGGVSDDGLAQLALLLQARDPTAPTTCADCDKYNKIACTVKFLDEVAQRIKFPRRGSDSGKKKDFDRSDLD